jgi:hypothetical protein
MDREELTSNPPLDMMEMRKQMQSEATVTAVLIYTEFQCAEAAVSARTARGNCSASQASAHFIFGAR